MAGAQVAFNFLTEGKAIHNWHTHITDDQIWPVF